MASPSRSPSGELARKASALRRALAKRDRAPGRGNVTEWRLPDAASNRQEHNLVFLFRDGADLSLVEVREPGTGAPAPLSQTALLAEAMRQMIKTSADEAAHLRQGAAGLTAAEAAALRRGGVELDAPVPGTALASGMGEWLALVQDSCSAAEAARHLDVNESRIRQRLGGDKPTLYGFRAGRAWLVPRFQFSERGALPGLEVVVPRLARGLHPVSVARWFKLPNTDLVDPRAPERTLSPRDWLLSGGPPEEAAALAAEL